MNAAVLDCESGACYIFCALAVEGGELKRPSHDEGTGPQVLILSQMVLYSSAVCFFR